jgi:hypothetical protein
MRYTGEPANIGGRPTFMPLNKGYPQMNRKQKLQAVQAANNVRLLGYGKATVGGRATRGFYFEATRGSAKGIAWHGGMKVYQVDGSLYFADERRDGIRVQAQESSLRKALVRLAYENPGKVRDAVLPLLQD